MSSPTQNGDGGERERKDGGNPLIKHLLSCLVRVLSKLFISVSQASSAFLSERIPEFTSKRSGRFANLLSQSSFGTVLYVRSSMKVTDSTFVQFVLFYNAHRSPVKDESRYERYLFSLSRSPSPTIFVKTHSRLSFGGCDLNRKKRVGKPKSSMD